MTVFIHLRLESLLNAIEVLITGRISKYMSIEVVQTIGGRKRYICGDTDSKLYYFGVDVENGAYTFNKFRILCEITSTNDVNESCEN